MAIQVTTDNPQELLDLIYSGIDKGTIETWAYDTDKDFFHNTPDGQWKGKAWLRPTVANGALILNVFPPNAGVSVVAYAVYHGRFIEMLLSHFDKKFSNAYATALATEEDRVKGKPA
jgi:hypothetical protein